MTMKDAENALHLAPPLPADLDAEDPMPHAIHFQYYRDTVAGRLATALGDEALLMKVLGVMDEVLLESDFSRSPFPTQEAEDEHRAWVIARVTASLNDPRPSIPHDVAMNMLREKLKKRRIERDRSDA